MFVPAFSSETMTTSRQKRLFQLTGELNAAMLQIVEQHSSTFSVCKSHRFFEQMVVEFCYCQKD